MIGYVTLGTNDFERASKFYDALMSEFGASVFMESDSFKAWWQKPGTPGLGIIKPQDKQAASVGNGVMIALKCTDSDQVDRMYAKAIELGGADEGPAGPRGDQFYGGYFRDLDGNKLVFYATS